MTHSSRTLKIFLAMLCLATVLCSTAQGAVTATVDRTTIGLDETLNLTINKDSSSFFSGLDLTPVEGDFTVLGQNQSSSTQIINGTVNSSVTWNIVLSPKRIGTLQIPAITVGKEETLPLTIHVVTRTEPKTNSADAPFFIETDIDTDSVYVQSQLIYTLRIFVAGGVQAQDPGLPQIADAVVEKLADASYTKMVEGRSYQVFELKYAVFPQKSGILEIPQMAVQATLPDQQRRTTLFDPFASQGKKVQLRSKGEQVTVREKPGSYPQSAIWLPTSDLTVADSWSQNPDNLKVGESATMTIEMSAKGLLGTQLPPIELGAAEGVKLYQGKAEVNNQPTSEGINGIRQESIALIPTRPGTIQLPEIRIPWWNTRTSTIQYAVIPAREVVITGEMVQTAPIIPLPDAQTTPVAVPTPSAPELPAGKNPVFWIVTSSILAVCWLVTILLLVRTRQQLAVKAPRGSLEENGAQTRKESKAFALFEKSCRNTDPLAARKAILSWAKSACPTETIHSLADLEKIFPGLALALKEIDSHLYSRGDKGKWQGSSLLAAVKEIRKRRSTKMNTLDGLEPLYK